MERPLYTCMTKGTDRAEGTPQFGMHWAVSRRGRFKVYPDRVELGDWRIPFASVERAVLYRFPYLPFVSARVLELEAGGRTYQFGFNPWAHPERHFSIAVEERETKARYSTFSVVLRVALLVYLAYLLWQWVA